MDMPVVGVDIGGTKMLLAAVWPDRVETRRAPTGSAAEQSYVEAEIRGFLASLAARPAALGVALPGLVDRAGALVACDVLPRLVGWRPAALAVGCPILALNDAEAALVEESRDLAGGAAALVMVGTGIGAAFADGGRTLRGAQGWAGELGSVPIATAQGTQTLDALASGAALAAQLNTDGAGVAARAAACDPAALEAIRAAGAMLGLGLATVINLLNPDLLIVGGGTAGLPGYLDAALAAAECYALAEPWRACAIRRARDAETIVALGAARAARL